MMNRLLLSTFDPLEALKHGLRHFRVLVGTGRPCFETFRPRVQSQISQGFSTASGFSQPVGPVQILSVTMGYAFRKLKDLPEIKLKNLHSVHGMYGKGFKVDRKLWKQVRFNSNALCPIEDLKTLGKCYNKHVIELGISQDEYFNTGLELFGELRKGELLEEALILSTLIIKDGFVHIDYKKYFDTIEKKIATPHIHCTDFDGPFTGDKHQTIVEINFKYCPSVKKWVSFPDPHFIKPSPYNPQIYAFNPLRPLYAYDPYVSLTDMISSSSPPESSSQPESSSSSQPESSEETEVQEKEAVED